MNYKVFIYLWLPLLNFPWFAFYISVKFLCQALLLFHYFASLLLQPTRGCTQSDCHSKVQNLSSELRVMFNVQSKWKSQCIYVTYLQHLITLLEKVFVVSCCIEADCINHFRQQQTLIQSCSHLQSVYIIIISRLPISTCLHATC
jgi:hypothetical protein